MITDYLQQSYNWCLFCSNDYPSAIYDVYDVYDVYDDVSRCAIRRPLYFAQPTIYMIY